jgi:hypothetical protein
MNFFGGGKKAAGNAAAATGKGLKGANAAILPSLAKNGGRVLGASGLLAVLAAAGELADEEDPMGRNIAQAGGNAAFGLGGAATGAALGTMILPGVGTVIGGGLGGFFGSQAGSNLGGGLYDAVTNETPQERAQAQAIATANLNNKIRLQQADVDRSIRIADAQAQIPLMKDVMGIKRADDFARGERQLQVQEDYNYSNALNQAMINAQQQRAAQELAMTQYMLT